ncbi:MAG: cell wall hydrolase [Suipraeoptans sp.]
MLTSFKKPFRRFACLLSITSILGSYIVATAAPGDDDSISGLNTHISDLTNQLDATTEELENLADEIEQTKIELSAATLNESQQYEAMKSRIKFMYEGGQTSLLQALFESKDMGDFLANAEYVTTITEYDRTMLDGFEEVSNQVAAKETELTKQQEDLSVMQTSLTEELEQANAELKEQIKIAAQRNVSTAITSSGSPITLTTDELVLFAAILQAEAGSNYDACMAVATVIMNRVESGAYPGTLSGVIYQSGQFSPTWNGSLNRILSNGPVDVCMQVATDALAGSRNAELAGWCSQFRMAGNRQGTVIGGNVFF